MVYRLTRFAHPRAQHTKVSPRDICTTVTVSFFTVSISNAERGSLLCYQYVNTTGTQPTHAYKPRPPTVSISLFARLTFRIPSPTAAFLDDAAGVFRLGTHLHVRRRNATRTTSFGGRIYVRASPLYRRRCPRGCCRRLPLHHPQHPLRRQLRRTMLPRTKSHFRMISYQQAVVLAALSSAILPIETRNTRVEMPWSNVMITSYFTSPMMQLASTFPVQP